MNLKAIKITIDSGNYFHDNDNLGDRAIYKTIANRLQSIFPGCTIFWMTRNVSIIQEVAPFVEPVFLSENRRSLDEKSPDNDRIHAAIINADLVLATGGGYFSDAFCEQSTAILDTLATALVLKRPAGILSCGFEPTRLRGLSQKMYEILPKLNFIACRESVQSPVVLSSFDVSAKNTFVTGDEAVDLAFRVRSDNLGSCLGINIRQADYANVDAGVIDRLRSIFEKIISKISAPVLSLPISSYGPSDHEAITALLDGIPGLDASGDQSLTLDEVLRRTAACRLVITGSYHAAVFALSQGVSVVALVASPHYRSKMQGLKAQFGSGCEIVNLERDSTAQFLLDAVDRAWKYSPEIRAKLLHAAQLQISQGESFYRRMRDHFMLLDDKTTSNEVTISDIEKARENHVMTSKLNKKIPQFSLTAEEMEQYRTQGFVGPFTAFDPSEMGRYQEIINDRVLSTPTPYCPFGMRVRHLDSKAVFDLCSSPAIVGRMESLFGSDLILWNSNIFNKPPAEPGQMEEYPWHQDHYNWKMEPVINISAWLAITPATLENGCVEFIPKSHRQIIPSAQDVDPDMSLRFGGVASDPAYVDERKKVAMVLEPGQFFLFNERVLHHSNPNRTALHRLGLAIRVTVPIAQVTESFPCIMLLGEDKLQFNQYIEPPKDEPDAEWVRSLPHANEFVFDRPLPGMGWHLREKDGGGHFAWTGLEPVAWLDFRSVTDADHMLTVVIAHQISASALDKLQLQVNGCALEWAHVASGHSVTLRAEVPRRVLMVRNDRVRLAFHGLERTRPCDINPASPDKRLLGVGVRSISLQPA